MWGAHVAHSRRMPESSIASNADQRRVWAAGRSAIASRMRASSRTGTQDQFTRRLADIRNRHDRKGKFIERLDRAGLR